MRPIDLLLESKQALTGETLNEAIVGPTFGTPLSRPTQLTADGVVKDKPMAFQGDRERGVRHGRGLRRLTGDRLGWLPVPRREG